MNINNKFIFSFIFITLILATGVLAITGSIGNAKMVLYPEIGIFGTTIEKSILVRNVNDEIINISLQASGDIENITKIIDKEFTLQPGEEKKAQFKITLKKPGNYEGKIFVLFSSLKPKEAGVALASTIIIFANGKTANESEENGDEGTIDENGDVADLNKTITGNVIGNIIGNSKITPSMIAVSVSTLILAVILIFLIFKIKSKSGKLSKFKNKNKKRRDRST